MRYADGGGLTAEGRVRRENVRLLAARLFEQDVDARRIAKILRVSTKSVYQRRRARGAAGDAALASRGPGGRGFGVAQIAVLDSPAPVRPRAAASKFHIPVNGSQRPNATACSRAARPVPSTGLLQVKRRGPCLPAAIAERLRAVRPGCSPPPLT